MAEPPAVILLPGGVLPASLAYEALLAELGGDVRAVAKELEVYAGDRPPPDYGLDTEIGGVLDVAEAAGIERFHAVGYSAGGAAMLALTARHSDRILSLALLEPAWAGNKGLDPAEAAARREAERATTLPPPEVMPAFVRSQLKPGVEPPRPPPGPTPPWMAKRPAGLQALVRAFNSGELDVGALGAFEGPVYFALGGLSNPDYYGKEAERLDGVFADFRLEVFDERHHFDPPHRTEPERLAASLRELWSRSVTPP